MLRHGDKESKRTICDGMRLQYLALGVHLVIINSVSESEIIYKLLVVEPRGVIGQILLFVNMSHLIVVTDGDISFNELVSIGNSIGRGRMQQETMLM